MNNSVVTTVALIAAAFLVGGASYYATDVKQAEELHTLENARQVAALNVQRVEELRVVEATNAQAAGAALSRWHARYKYIPNSLNTADIVEYLEGLTRGGFEQFDLKLAGNVPGPDFSTYTFEVEGMGTYMALYQLVWHLENNREFYRINDLRMEEMHVIQPNPDGSEISRDLVRFTFRLDVYYSMPGIHAPADSLQPIPEGVLPPYTPDRDIFRPLVRVPREDPNAGGDAAAEGDPAAAPGTPAATATPAAPPEPQGLNVETARLAFILGNRAFFDDARGRHIVEVGDPVVGGEITQIDANGGTVRARITQAGQVRMVVRTTGTGGGGGERPPAPSPSP